MTPMRSIARSVQTRAFVAVAVSALLIAAVPAQATPVILNGGFESGFTGWHIENQVGSDGTFFSQSGTTSPDNGDPVPLPPGPTHAAMTDAFGPGSHVLYQDFLFDSSATLSFDLFIGNRDTAFFTPSSLVGLDFSTPDLNQQARVDIIATTANPFSVSSTDVLLNLYQSKPGDALVSGYTSHKTDLSPLLTGHKGETLRLRFAEVDNVAQFQLGVDNVGFVPEPASLFLLGTGLAALGIRLRRR